MKKVLLLILLTTSVLLCQNYKKVKVYLTEKQDVYTLASIGIAVEESFYNKKEGSLSMFVTDYEFNEIKKTLDVKVLIENWMEHFNQRIQSDAVIENQMRLSKTVYNVSEFGFGSHAGFYTVEEVNNKLDSMRLKYPSIITTKMEIGKTFENRSMYAVKISDSPEIDEDEPEVFYNAMIHAREPESMMTLMYFMYYLLENYNVDPEVTYLVNNRELYFVPIINVDGYEHNRLTVPQGGGMYRTNKNGVDLNRNFGHHWGYDDFGSSPTPGSLTYRGISPFSEPETQVLRDFCNSRNFVSALNYHTFSNLLIFPWSYENLETPDSLVFRDFAQDMTEYNNYTWGTSGAILYVTNGDADDWMYGEQSTKRKIISMTPEVGGDTDGFWPPKERIFPLAQENLFPNLYLAWTAGAYVKLTDYHLDKQYVNPGDNIMFTPVLKNKGLNDMQAFSAELIPLSDKAAVANPLMNFAGLNSRTTLTSTEAFKITISSSASAQEDVKFALKIKMENVIMSVDTIHVKIGTPAFIFNDTSDLITDNWITQGGWDITEADYHSAPNCYTDSKSGVYQNNHFAALILKESIDLKEYKNPFLTFYTKYQIESEWDYAQVKISIDNGVTWKALKGNYSKIGSNYQPEEPLYDGNQHSWLREEIDLSEYSGAKIKIKFELTTDGWTQRDGWYIDDIAIIYYSVLPVELASFSITPERNAVKLSWTTTTELNNSGFVLQRSPDKVKWSDIHFIRGSGTTSTPSKYIYYDKSPLNGTSNYRLQQVDFNGTKEILELGEVNAAGIYDYSLSQNYPNPFNPETVISYTLSEPGIISLKVYDITGSECAVLVNSFQEAGRYEAVVNAAKQNLSSGSYIYTLRVNGYREEKKMMMIK